MKKNVFSLLLCFMFLFTSSVYAEDLGNWELRADISLARYGNATISENGKIYNIGGYYHNNGVKYASNVDEYDPSTDKWIIKSNLPKARAIMGIASVNHKIYIFGGLENGTPVKTVEEYDPVTNSWSKKTDMPTAKYGMGVAVVDNKIYVIGGQDGRNFFNTVEEYDPLTDTWTKKNNMPSARTGSAVTFNQKIYMIGGANTNGSYNVPLKTVEEYDPLTDTWTKKTDMPIAKGAPAVAIHDKIYVIGGFVISRGSNSYSDSTSTVEEYTPSSDTWRTVKSLNIARYNHSATVLNDKIYAVAGAKTGSGSVSYLKSTEVFTPPVTTPDTIEINLTASAGNSVVNLNWETDINASGYVVKRSTTPGGPYEVIANNVTEKSYVDNNVQNGTTYYYVVTALENGTETKTSNEASATPTADGSTEPDPDIKGNRALLVITMTNANRKEYDMSADEIKAFINWYNGRTNGSGLKYYVINKNYNIGPFSSRKDHIVFDQISDFEVMEYNKW